MFTIQWRDFIYGSYDIRIKHAGNQPNSRYYETAMLDKFTEIIRLSDKITEKYHSDDLTIFVLRSILRDLITMPFI